MMTVTIAYSRHRPQQLSMNEAADIYASDIVMADEPIFESITDSFT